MYPGQTVPRGSEIVVSTRQRGAFAAVLGPDGSGKTTVATNIGEVCRSDGIGFGYVHWRPSLRQAPHPSVPRQEGHPPPKQRRPDQLGISEKLLSIARLLRSVLVFNMYFVLRVAPMVRSGSVVIADRWVFNYLVQPDSVRYYASHALALLACRRLTARPPFLFVLAAEPSVLFARKQELTIEDLQRELRQWDQLKKSFNIQFLDATLAPDLLARRVLDQILANHR